MFASYEAELEQLTEAVRSGLEVAQESQDEARERRKTMQKCEVDLAQAESLLRQMGVEARTDPSASALKKKLAAYRDNMKKLRQEYSSVQQKLERQDLMESRNGGAARMNSGRGSEVSLSQSAKDDRARFEQVTARLDRSTESLLESRRALAETEEVAMNISDNLASNRSVILNVHERITATTGLLGGAGQILRRMRQQETRRKMMLWCLIGVLIFSVSMIFYLALRPASSNSSHQLR